LERQGDEAAGLIRELVGKINMLREGANPALNEDLVFMLSEAAKGLGHLEDSAGAALLAAEKFAGLEDLIQMLNDTAEQIRCAQDMM
jgi:hypothetical protein